MVEVVREFKASEELEDCYGSVLLVTVVKDMQLIKKRDLVMIPDPIRIRKDEIKTFIENYIGITKIDNL